MLPNTSSLTERLQEMQTSWMEGWGMLRRRRWERGEGEGYDVRSTGKQEIRPACTPLPATARSHASWCAIHHVTRWLSWRLWQVNYCQFCWMSTLALRHGPHPSRRPLASTPATPGVRGACQESLGQDDLKKKNENKMTMRAPLTELSSGGVCGERAKHRFHTIHCLVPAKASLFENICFGRILSRMTDLSHKEMAAE